MAYIEYRNGFNGTYKVGGQTLLIGKEKLMPYDMTYGAIASCLYSNFTKSVGKRGLKVSGTDVVVNGVKRDTVPATVKELTISFNVYTDASYEDILESFNEAIENCSMVQTFKMVAELKTEVKINAPEEMPVETVEGDACDVDGKGC